MIPTQPPASLRRIPEVLCALLLSAAISGCATLGPRAASGDFLPTSSPTPSAATRLSDMPGDSPDNAADIRTPSRWSHLGRGATRALRSPAVWAPSAIALLLQIDGLDGRLSDWARRETPVFGSQTRAQDAGDALLQASVITYAALFAITPAPQGSGTWLRDKSVRGAAGLATLAANAGVTSVVKYATGRERPDGSDDLSFPSGHASGAATAAALTAGEARRLPGPGWVRSTLSLGSGAIAGGCAWARVEAGRHYPSDALVGWALGTAFGTFTNEVLRSRAGATESPAVSVRVGRHSVQLALTIPLSAEPRR